MTKKNVGKQLLEYLLIAVGCLSFSFGIALFLNPNGLAPGGVSGIAIIVNGLTGFPTGLMMVLINIPLLLAGCFVIGKGFLIKTVYAIAVSSVFIDLWPKIFPALVPVTTDKMLAGIAGAVLSAVGIGIVFRCGGSTGGTDIVAKLLRRKFRSLKTGAIFMIIDSMIVVASAIASRHIEDALYAAIALFLTSFVLDRVLYGTDGAKLLIIISRNHEAIAHRLLEELDVGVTYAEGFGAYTGEGKKIIICAVKKHLFHKAKDLVKGEDPASFMIVSSATEVFGQGYKPHGAEEL
ncbi:MAG: YitT family protein [Clostridia bacterium]|nr:YitT family protein [Clostridia bacterium]